MKKKGWLFIFTCKDVSVYSLSEEFTNMFNLTFEQSFKVEYLEESEVLDIAKEHNISIPQEPKFLRSLRLPFYLAQYIELGFGDNLTFNNFREKVWKAKVIGHGQRASQIKRERCLHSIVENIQNTNTYIINYEDTDIESATQLVDAGVLGEYPHRGFFIKHDIYIDWTLTYIIEKKFENKTEILEVLKNNDVGIQYINVFKRILTNGINDNKTTCFDICHSIFRENIAYRWQKAVYECIGRSEKFAKDWIDLHSAELKANEYEHFNAFVDNLVVTCKYVDQYITLHGKEYPLMKPLGSGWEASIDFVWRNVDDYYLHNLATVQKLIDDYSWYKNANSKKMYYAGMLALRIFDLMANERKNGQSFWFYGMEEKWTEIVCRYAFAIKEEIKERLNLVITNRWTSHRDPYAELIEYILKKTNSINLLPLCLVCKKEIINLLNIFWLEKTGTEQPFISAMNGADYAFGLNLDFEGCNAYFPSSAYQTPIYALLQADSILLAKEDNSVVDFIIEFVNERVRVFNKRGFANAEIELVYVKLKNGEEHEIISSECLWNIYRGTSGLAMPHLMESMHMALEKYLLELSEKNENLSKVDKILWNILQKSHSCSLYAIVSSVASAHPKEYFEQLLFLMQDIRFLTMDLMRHTREIHAKSIEFAYYGHKDLLNEREKANSAKHHNEHLESLLTKFQVGFEYSKEIDKLNMVYDVVDSLKEQLSTINEEERTLAKYVILRIDVRAMEKKTVVTDDGVNRIEYTPVLTDEMKAERKQLNDYSALRWIILRQWIDFRYKRDLQKAAKYEYDNNIKLVLESIREIKEQLSIKAADTNMLPGDQYLPFTASAILLSQFTDKLSDEESKELQDCLMLGLSDPLFMLNSPMSELDICLSAIPSLIVYEPLHDSLISILVMYSMHKQGNYNSRPCDYVYYLISNSNLWKDFPSFMDKVFKKYMQTIEVENVETINKEQAESLLCILSSNTTRRELGILCMNKIADYWKPKDTNKYHYTVGNFELAFLISDYWIHAPVEEVALLVKPFKPYINGDMRYDNLISLLVYKTAQYSKYDIYWIVWDEFYDGIVHNTHSFYNSPTINTYLLNPDTLAENAGDWFDLNKKDIRYFERIANDMGRHPSVIYSISKVFATIGRKYNIDILPTINTLIQKEIYHFEDGLKSATIFYLEKIMEDSFVEFFDECKNRPVFNRYIVNILEFMQKNGSTKATTLLNQI